MKKTEYYINVRSNMVSQSEMQYPKVSGYIEEVEDSKGNKLTIGYHKADKNCWVATELKTGLKCNMMNYNTKAECVEYVHKMIDKIVEAFDRAIHSDWGEQYITPFRQFVDLQEFLKE